MRPGAHPCTADRFPFAGRIAGDEGIAPGLQGGAVFDRLVGRLLGTGPDAGPFELHPIQQVVAHQQVLRLLITVEVSGVAHVVAAVVIAEDHAGTDRSRVPFPLVPADLNPWQFLPVQPVPAHGMSGVTKGIIRKRRQVEEMNLIILCHIHPGIPQVQLRLLRWHVVHKWRINISTHPDGRFTVSRRKSVRSAGRKCSLFA